jgi:GNAT superfamily N-acetyltransferase
MLPSINPQWKDSVRLPPRVYILEALHTDRPDGPPSDALIVERVETVCLCKDGTAADAQIRISFQRLNSAGARGPNECGFFDGRYVRGFGEEPADLSLTGGAVEVPYPLRGKGIGTYFMNEVVTWGKQWPDAEVRQIKLSPRDGTPENKDRRNRFYEQFGLKLIFSDPEHRGGRSSVIKSADLNTVDSWMTRVRTRTVDEFISDLLQQTDALKRETSSQSGRIEHLRGRIDAAEKRPVRWAARQLWYRWSGIVMPLTFFGLIGYGIWKLLTEL